MIMTERMASPFLRLWVLDVSSLPDLKASSLPEADAGTILGLLPTLQGPCHGPTTARGREQGLGWGRARVRRAVSWLGSFLVAWLTARCAPSGPISIRTER